MCQNVCKKVLLTVPEFHEEIQSHSGVLILGDWQKCTLPSPLPSKDEGPSEIGNNMSMVLDTRNTAQKMKFSINDFSSKCDQIRSFLGINGKLHFLCSGSLILGVNSGCGFIFGSI